MLSLDAQILAAKASGGVAAGGVGGGGGDVLELERALARFYAYCDPQKLASVGELGAPFLRQYLYFCTSKASKLGAHITCSAGSKVQILTQERRCAASVRALELLVYEASSGLKLLVYEA
jgi:hypothetical protein